MESYEDLLKGKSLDELLQEAQVLQQKPLDIKILNEVKEQGLEVIVRPAENVESYEVVKLIGRKILYGSACTVKYLGGFFHGFFETCFRFPTTMRRIDDDHNSMGHEEYPNPCPKFSQSYNIGYFSGFVLPSYSSILSFGGIPIVSYIILFSKNPLAGWSLLGTQITTNALSGLYEWFRYEKNKLKDKEKIKNGK